MNKILIIAYACEPNKGSEPGVGWNWALNLSKYVDVTVITRANNRKLINNELQKNNYNNLSFVYYDLPKPIIKFKNLIGTWMYYILWQIGIVFFFKKKLKKENFDLVHHVTFMSYRFTLAPLFGIKNIVGPVGGLELLPKRFLLFTGHPIREFIRNILIKKYKYSILYNFLNLKIDRLILTSQNNIRLVNKKFYNKIIVMQIGTNDIKPPHFIENKTKIEIYWGGILERWKGLELLLLALKNINYDFHLSITGKGRDEDYFKNIVKKNSLHSKVTFYGWVTSSELNEIKDSCDIFVFTSLRDTTGSILLEMMGRGKPCIVLDTGGPSEICNSINSVKIEARNINQVISDLSRTIEWLINNPKERIKIGFRAYEEINKNYLWEEKAKRMIKIYEEVLNENTSSS